jgi:tetratricopeptide (TPR) repeat protein
MRKLFLLSFILLLCLNSLLAQSSKDYFNRAMSKSRNENYKEAIADFNMAVEFDQNYKEAIYNRGVAKA